MGNKMEKKECIRVWKDRRIDTSTKIGGGGGVAQLNTTVEIILQHNIEQIRTTTIN